jgi:hypothetical protein
VDQASCPLRVVRIKMNVFLRVRVSMIPINVFFKLSGIFKGKHNGKNILERKLVVTETCSPTNCDGLLLHCRLFYDAA